MGQAWAHGQVFIITKNSPHHYLWVGRPKTDLTTEQGLALGRPAGTFLFTFASCIDCCKFIPLPELPVSRGNYTKHPIHPPELPVWERQLHQISYGIIWRCHHIDMCTAWFLAQSNFPRRLLFSLGRMCRLFGHAKDGREEINIYLLSFLNFRQIFWLVRGPVCTRSYKWQNIPDTITWEEK